MICSHAPAIHDHGRGHDHGHGHDHDHDHDHDHGHKVSQFIIFIHVGTVRKTKMYNINGQARWCKALLQI